MSDANVRSPEAALFHSVRSRIIGAMVRWRRTKWANGLGTALLLLWTLPPILYLWIISVKPERLMLGAPQLIFHPTFERYRALLTFSNMGLPVWNSLTTSVIGAAGAVVLGSLLAFAFRVLDFRGKILLLFVILLPRMFPPVTTLIPVYLGLKILGLIDTRTALVILFIGFQIPLVVWIMGTFFINVPHEIVESAALDGASLLTIFTKIVLPLSGPGLLSAYILCFIFNWNEFLFPLIVASFNAKTGAVAIMNYVEDYKRVSWGSLAVLGVAMTIPVILFVGAFRAYLIRGLTAGALKG